VRDPGGWGGGGGKEYSNDTAGLITDECSPTFRPELRVKTEGNCRIFYLKFLKCTSKTSFLDVLV
jgi:hypothetical protein